MAKKDSQSKIAEGGSQNWHFHHHILYSLHSLKKVQWNTIDRCEGEKHDAAYTAQRNLAHAVHLSTRQVH